MFCSFVPSFTTPEAQDSALPFDLAKCRFCPSSTRGQKVEVSAETSRKRGYGHPGALLWLLGAVPTFKNLLFSPIRHGAVRSIGGSKREVQYAFEPLNSVGFPFAHIMDS